MTGDLSSVKHFLLLVSFVSISLAFFLATIPRLFDILPPVMGGCILLRTSDSQFPELDTEILFQYVLQREVMNTVSSYFLHCIYLKRPPGKLSEIVPWPAKSTFPIPYPPGKFKQQCCVIIVSGFSFPQSYLLARSLAPFLVLSFPIFTAIVFHIDILVNPMSPPAHEETVTEWNLCRNYSKSSECESHETKPRNER